MSSKTLLIDFPPEITTKVLKKLDLFSILKLRKVSYDLRQFIDENVAKESAEVIRLKLVDHSIEICFKSPKPRNVKFEQKDNDCWMTWRNANYAIKKEIFKNKNFINIFLNEFQIIIKHHGRSVLDLVSVEIFERKTCSMLHKMLTKIGSLRTKKVVFQDCNPAQIGKILPFFDAKDLERIVIDGFFEEHDSKEDEMRTITESEQWKRAKYVDFETEFYVPQIQDFLHFLEVKIECNKIPYQNIILLKENFPSTLTRFEIHLYNSFRDTHQIHASFGIPANRDPDEWYFRIPNNEKEVVNLAVEDRDHFIFRRVKTRGAVYSMNHI